MHRTDTKELVEGGCQAVDRSTGGCLGDGATGQQYMFWLSHEVSRMHSG